jgi:hypothetical protein
MIRLSHRAFARATCLYKVSGAELALRPSSSS